MVNFADIWLHSRADLVAFNMIHISKTESCPILDTLSNIRLQFKAWRVETAGYEGAARRTAGPRQPAW
jgi:hypothetical protein